jgi:CDP-glycerol glycerophosphotransferase
LAANVPSDTEVIIVDDGSTDEGGLICDTFALGREGWQVIHQVNAGLGAARNVGFDAASGEFVGFVDGDDTILPAYAVLLARAVSTGLDVATGAVLRTDGRRSWPSGLHARALDPVGDVASMERDHSLIFDTTAWNKVYRRAFLLKHGLRFPEGVLYEDLPLTIPALYLAGEVACVHEPVYVWRTRQHGLSITQRRHEIQNLRDRFAAVSQVDAFLEEHDLHELRVAHDDKVLGLDLPLYTAALPEASEDYRAAYHAFFGYLARGLTAERRNRLPPTLRLYVELAEAGRMDDLVAAVTARRGKRAWADDRRSRLQRVRQDLATYGLERELGLATSKQLLGRGAASTMKILLPSFIRRPLSDLRRRLRARRAPRMPRPVRSIAGCPQDQVTQTTGDLIAPPDRQVKDA